MKILKYYFDDFVIPVSILIILLCVIILTGCLSQPDKKDFQGRPNSCYDFSMCMYLNQKNPDKSVCVDYAKECRAIDRFNFCKDEKNLPEGVGFQSCWDKLNSK